MTLPSRDMNTRKIRLPGKSLLVTEYINKIMMIKQQHVIHLYRLVICHLLQQIENNIKNKCKSKCCDLGAVISLFPVIEAILGCGNNQVNLEQN